MMVVINDIKDTPVQLYCPAGKLIGTVETGLQVNDVCIQIKRMKKEGEESGYYFICEGERVPIMCNGRIPNLNHLGISFFDINCKQLEEILFS